MTEETKTKQIHLNEYQRAAVLDESPACVVNANVGSGKTTVLIEKILYLHQENQVPLEQMVVLTFTNKAADEIAERLMRREPQITSEQVQGFGTFHSVALRLLKNRLSVEKAGWTKEFTVMDPDEELELALDIISERGLKVKYKNRLKKRMEQEYQQYLGGKTETRYKDDLFLLYPLLEEEKKRQNKMAFADLLRVSAKLLRDIGGQSEAADRSGKSGWHPEWVIVDEVQDSDRLQLEFLEGQIAELEEQISSLLKQTGSYITTIPGIGDILGAIILSEIGDIHRFDAPNKLVAFAGLDVRVTQSGEFTGTRQKISKRGSPYLRRAIWLAASRAAFCDPILSEYYQSLRARGKHHLTAIGAVSRKLCNTIYTILKEDRPWQPIPPRDRKVSNHTEQ